MPTPLENAHKRLGALWAEVARVERFISDYHEFSGNVLEDFGAIPLNGNVSAIEKSHSASWRVHCRKPDEIAQMIERILFEAGKPLTRGQLVDALSARDIELPSEDKARYIGTIIWRHKSIFINVEGRGYWLRDKPFAPAPAPLSTAEKAESETAP